MVKNENPRSEGSRPKFLTSREIIPKIMGSSEISVGGPLIENFGPIFGTHFWPNFLVEACNEKGQDRSCQNPRFQIWKIEKIKNYKIRRPLKSSTRRLPSEISDQSVIINICSPICQKNRTRPPIDDFKALRILWFSNTFWYW